MSTIVTIAAGDLISASRSDINTNFSNLNTDKMETSVLDTDTTLAANSDSKVATQKATKAYVDSLGGLQIVPTGSVVAYGASTAPTGWLLCDGTAVSRSTYATLFGIVGTTFGSGNGSTTFNVPDLRSRFILGAGTASTKIATFASRSSNVITVTGLTNAANNEFQTGQAVVYHTTGSVITGLTNDVTYYVVRTGNLTFSLATTLANAQNGTVITLSGDGTGTQTFTLTFTARTLADTGGEENHAMSSTELLAHTHADVYAPGSGAGQVDTSVTARGNVTGSAGGNAAMNDMPPFAALTYIIRT